jgi:alpha-tubulin suppressor-like RCC1 family protein
LFVWGSNIYWQLGFEVDGGEESISIPHQLEHDTIKNIVAIYAEHHFTLALDSLGKVF